MSERHPYHCIFAKVSKQDEEEFVRCMEELDRKMLLTGHTDYDDICSEIIDYIAEYGKDQDEFTITRDTLNEWEEEDHQVFNLTAYLQWLEEHHPDVFEEMNQFFDGLPGYGGEETDIE